MREQRRPRTDERHRRDGQREAVADRIRLGRIEDLRFDGGENVVIIRRACEGGDAEIASIR